MYMPLCTRCRVLVLILSEVCSRSNWALCCAPHNAHYAEPGIMRSYQGVHAVLTRNCQVFCG